MNQAQCGNLQLEICQNARLLDGMPTRIPRWYALFTEHQHEKKVVRQLHQRKLEAFCPTYQEQHIWRNRQKKTIELPLFPSYVFAQLRSDEYYKALMLTSVHRIVGTSSGPVAVSDQEIQFLRRDAIRTQCKPYKGLAIGERVRIRSGPMEGVEGVLTRHHNAVALVVSVAAINQSVSLHIDASVVDRIS